MTYLISVVDSDGVVIHTETWDEHPAEDYLVDLAARCGGEFCDISRLEELELSL